MPAIDWWLPALPSAIEQGDVFAGIPFVFPDEPVKALLPERVDKKLRAYLPVEEPRLDHDTHRMYFLAQGRVSNVLVLNHGCDIEKPSNKRLLVLEVRPIAALNPTTKDHVINDRTIAMIYLPAVPGIGDSFVDLRIITTIDRGYIDTAERKASMSDAGRSHLQARLVMFLAEREEWNRPAP